MLTAKVVKFMKGGKEEEQVGLPEIVRVYAEKFNLNYDYAVLDDDQKVKDVANYIKANNWASVRSVLDDHKGTYAACILVQALNLTEHKLSEVLGHLTKSIR